MLGAMHSRSAATHHTRSCVTSCHRDVKRSINKYEMSRSAQGSGRSGPPTAFSQEVLASAFPLASASAVMPPKKAAAGKGTQRSLLLGGFDFESYPQLKEPMQAVGESISVPGRFWEGTSARRRTKKGCSSARSSTTRSRTDLQLVRYNQCTKCRKRGRAWHWFPGAW